MDAWLTGPPKPAVAAKKPAPVKKAPPAKKKKKPKPAVSLLCPEELLTAHNNGTLYSLLQSATTNDVKSYCAQCKVPRSGAKYKIVALLTEHVEKAGFAATCDESSEEGALTLEFSQLSFARARTKFNKLAGDLKKSDGGERWTTIVAAALGFDQVIYNVITGPNCKQYNGSRGEAGIEANEEIGLAVGEALVCAAGAMEETELDEALEEVISSCTKCEPYGFYNYDCFLKKGAARAAEEFARLPEDRRKKITEAMAVPSW